MKSQTHSVDSRDYQRIAKSIEYILEHFREQPSLEVIAAASGLSSWHFNRLFRRWAGVTPKQLVQFLTLRTAKASLDRKMSVLTSALDAGLSGSGRLHDLFVSIEAMTPGEYKSGGEGLVLTWGYGGSPFGSILMASCDRGIVHLAFVDDGDRRESFAELKSSWPNATFICDDERIALLADQMFSGSDRQVSLCLKGTNFQFQVWQALLRIPTGSQVSYQSLAAQIGKPQSVRAVANACGRNPVAWLIPCHRVLRATGALGGYRWGVDRKAGMLTWEALRQGTGA
jgi:AraC family transcriptional regulator, regulatory protein of adaptative response / methylated-DNA-[protein]-cysteine methyltransferase